MLHCASCGTHLKRFAIRKLTLIGFLVKSVVWEDAHIFWHLNTLPIRGATKRLVRFRTST